MRNLLTDPAWQPEDLGIPLPDTLHAVSVAMPMWQDVIDYEEGAPRVTEALQCGYPRFFVHPKVMEVFKAAERKFAKEGECCLVFPSNAAAERCREFVEARANVAVRIGEGDMWVGDRVTVVMPKEAYRTARLYWRYCGDTLSSRFAERILAGIDPDLWAKALGDTARKATAAIQERLAGLYGVSPEDVFLYPSGMAAVSALHRALRVIHPGLPSVQLDFPYVDVLKVQEEYSGVKFFPVADDSSIAEVRSLAREKAVSGVFCEMPSNPLLRCVRVSHFADELKENGVLLFIDDTIAGVTNINALKYSDAVTTSLSKAFSGAGDVLAGAVTLNPRSPHYYTLFDLLHGESRSNSQLWGDDTIQLEKNSRDFVDRASRMSANAAALAEWLEKHPAVEAVYYPRGDDGFEEIARPGAGRGCLLSLILKDPAKAPAVYDHLEISKGPSLGTNFSLCCPYTLLAHYTELDWAARCGVRADLLRVSVGLEDTTDLIARFHRALEHAS